MIELLASSGLGSLLGMRHALEPDHLAAVSTLVSRERGAFRAAWLGICWGAGHTLALLTVGIALVAFRLEMPVALARAFEFGVAIMLVVLGLRAIRQAVREGADNHPLKHRRGIFAHHHAGGPAHVHIGSWTIARRPLLIGAVHGLAGSGALTALVLATLPSTAARLAYMMLFGLGSMLGMAALSGLLGWPLARLSSQDGLGRAIRLIVGCVSTSLGIYWGYRML